MLGTTFLFCIKYVFYLFQVIEAPNAFNAFSALENALKLCNINDSYGEVPQELIRYIQADGENLSITSYDPFHSVLLNTKLEFFGIYLVH